MKRLFSIVIILTILLCTGGALAAGTAEDPLISQAYLEGGYQKKLDSWINDAVNWQKEIINGDINELSKLPGYKFAEGFTKISLGDKDKLTLAPGASFMLSSGSASISFSGGNVINTTAGTVVGKSGAALAAGQRYFCGDDAVASIVASGASSGYVDGYYRITPQSAAKVQPPQPTPPVITISNIAGGSAGNDNGNTDSNSGSSNSGNGNSDKGDTVKSDVSSDAVISKTPEPAPAPAPTAPKPLQNTVISSTPKPTPKVRTTPTPAPSLSVPQPPPAPSVIYEPPAGSLTGRESIANEGRSGEDRESIEGLFGGSADGKMSGRTIDLWPWILAAATLLGLGIVAVVIALRREQGL